MRLTPHLPLRGLTARILAFTFFYSFFYTWSLAQIADPIPESPELSGITIQLEEFAQIPQSASSAPRARINHLKPMNDAAGRLLVNDLRGKFWIITDGVVSEYADVDALFPAFSDSPGLGTGFTSFAFHPEFATNGIFYTAHSETPAGTADFIRQNTAAQVSLHGIITEWTATDPAAATFAGTRRELMRVELTGTIHGMQEISFNPNSQIGDTDYGMLYICIGDGQSTIRGFPENSRGLNSVLGTILRIDPAGTNGRNGLYGVPADNPWVADGDAETYDEIWAHGFRNPHRISWDTAGDGKMLSGDIGERNIEELNLIEAGRDYGWNEREGTFVINPEFENNPANGTRDDVFELPANDAELGLTYPVAQYDHDVGAAIVSGYVYRGSLAPVLTGKFIMGDILDGKVYFVEADTLVFGTQAPIKELSLELDGTPITIQGIDPSNRADLRFGYDNENELYLTEKSRGTVYKVVGATSSGIVTEPASGGKLVNLSTRSQVGIDDDVLIGGFVIGNTSQKVLIQAIGTELASSGVDGVLADPVLEIFNDANVSLGINDDWEDDATAATEIRDLWGGALPFADGSTSSALILTLDQGSYTAVISGKDDTTGVALVEVYEID